MALPGSLLYKKAKDEGIELPRNYEGYSFHSTIPLPTEKLTAKEVITLRDEAFNIYHNHKFLKLNKEKNLGLRLQKI